MNYAGFIPIISSTLTTFPLDRPQSIQRIHSSTTVTYKVDKACKERFINGQRLCTVEPLNISFTCKREADSIDIRVVEIYKKIFNGTIQEEFTHNQQCNHTQVVGPCGNQRKFLNECRCGPLDRVTKPSLRQQYENQIIFTILAIKQKLPFQSTFNITIFASGGLHGELVLMVKLINRLKQEDFSGCINLFLIDRIYADNIKFASASTENSPVNWEAATGRNQALGQFLTEIALGLPQAIQVASHVFGDIDDYIWRLEKDSNFDWRCDLLIGADTGDNGTNFAKLQSSASRTQLPGIALAKFHETPQLCLVTPKGMEVCVPIQ
ncbi:hypothetical protein [Neochlamydia sp. AcF65]|uniref:hypothetical protein n=1 Tax=Neochlamydia sp. AcF65 TaxID=2795735 RepID=UPI001BC9F20C|nr:hypothetical protein [Neochlamydia sp. AcF65]